MAIQVLNSSTTTVDASSATPIVVSVTNVGLTGPAGVDAPVLSPGTGIDIVGTDISVDVSDFMSNGVDNRVVTASGADTMNAEANFTFSNEEVVIASTSSAKPTLALANANSDANGPGLIFAKQPSGSAANNDVAGTIQYQAFNDANQLTAITSISSQITNVADGAEAGKYNILVTANGSTIQPGLQLEGSSLANQVDATIGAGTSSVTTLAGTLTMGTTAAMTNAGQLSVAAQPNITSLGTLTSLQVDNINIDGNTITSSTAADLTINVTDGQSVVIEGVDIDDGVVTGASSITSTSFVGALTGNASTATALATPRAFQTDLASTSAVNFDGSAANTHGVTGTLPVANGGTGATSFTANELLFGNGTSAIQSSSNLTYSGSTFSITDSDSFQPVLRLENTHNSALSGNIIFSKSRDSGTSADGDRIGQIFFIGHDDAGNTGQQYGLIECNSKETGSGQEGGKIFMQVASHDGSNVTGFSIEDGDAAGEVDATIAAGTSSLTTVAGNLKVTTAESVNGNYSSLVVDSSNSVVKSDERVKTLKVTGARMKTMGSSPLTVFAAPGANTAIQMIEATMFVDYSGTDASFPSSIVSGSEQNRLQFICTPDDGVSNSTVVPLGTFTRGQVNNALSKDTLVVRDIPQVQARLGINKPIQLKFRNVSTGNGVDSVATPGSDFFFKIKYRVVDTTSDFVVSATDTALTP